ncbi:Phenoloxidase-activating factor 2-like 5, partial [Homarus americanus]
GAPLNAPRSKLSSDTSPAKEGEYPWHVAILSIKQEYLCGGVVVADRHVLTVAHCIQHLTARDILVRVGDYDLSTDSEKYPTYDVTVVSITTHPEYRRNTLKADISLIRVEYQLLSLPNVARVCFPNEVSTHDRQECYVPAWGFVEPAKGGWERYKNFSPVLRDSRFVIIDRTKCERQFRESKTLGSFFKLLQGFICCKGILQSDTCH